MTYRILKVIPFTLILASLTGCITFPRKAFPEKSYYILDVDREPNPVTSKKNAILSIRNLTIAAPFDQKEFIYRKGNSEYGSDFYNEFLSAPNTMITEIIRLWFFEAGSFQNIILQNSHVTPTHILEGKVTGLYADLHKRGELKSIIGIEFTLIDDVKSDPNIIFQKMYKASVDLSKDSPNDLVTGWNQGLGQILSEFESDLLKLSINDN